MTDIEELKSLPVEEAAYRADCRLRQIEQEFKANFAELGEVALVARERELWRYASKMEDGITPKSFTEWITDCLPVSNGSAFAALRIAEKLAHMPVEERALICRSNLERLAKLSFGVQIRKDIKEAARLLAPSAFAEYVEREYPGQHLEADVVIRFRVDRSVKVKVDEALKQAMAFYECGRDEAFGYICEAYLLVETQ